MRRADRLFQIVQYLRGGRLVRAEDLAGKLEVSKRTIYRDVADLIGSGVPIEGEAGVGYVMRGGYDMPPLMFTSEEVLALAAGARMIRAWGGAQMAAAAEEALVKIDAVVPEDLKGTADRVPIHAMELPQMTAEVRRALDRIEQAVDGRIGLQITYGDETGATTIRRVRPLGLWFWGKVWTLVAWCELRDDFRMFRIDRISALEEGAPYRAEPGTTLRDFFAQASDRPASGPVTGPDG